MTYTDNIRNAIIYVIVNYLAKFSEQDSGFMSFKVYWHQDHYSN